MSNKQPYEIHCTHCERMVHAFLDAPPAPGLTVSCSASDCKAKRNPTEPLFVISPMCADDTREWVGATCTVCAGPFEYPRYIAYPDRESVPTHCRECYIRSLNATVNARSLADEWKRDLGNYTLQIRFGAALNTGPCPPVALRPDAITSSCKQPGSTDLYVTSWGYAEGKTHHARTYWHPSIGIATLICQMPDSTAGTVPNGARLHITSRRTGDAIVDADVSLDQRIIQPLVDAQSPQPSSLSAAAKSLIAAWDNNWSLADEIGALREQVG